MGRKNIPDSIQRRKVLRSAAAGAVGTTLVGSATAQESSDRKKALTDSQRAKMAARYDFERARETLFNHTGSLRRELTKRGVIDTETSVEIGRNGLQRGYTKGTTEGTVRVKPTWNEKTGSGIVLVDAELQSPAGAVLLSVNTDTETGVAIVFESDGVTTALTTDGETVTEVEPADIEGNCGDVCDDCCGFWDCSAKVEATIYVNGQPVASGCGCVEGGGLPSPYCCEDDSCDGTIPCSC